MQTPTPNYYQQLGILFSSSEQDIRRAMTQYAQSHQSDDDIAFLQACKTHLLDPEARKTYNRQLLIENPTLLIDSGEVELMEEQEESTDEDNQGHGRLFKKIIMLVVILFVGVGVVLSIMTSGSKGSKKTAKLDEWSAQVACEQAVSERLKSPSSADFSGWTRTDNGNNTFAITGYVDAQNSFGAKVRTQFRCTVRDNGNATTNTSIDLLK